MGDDPSAVRAALYESLGVLLDLDFDWRVRDEVIDHVFQRYGPDHTAMVSSHLFLQPRSAFREAGKIHGLSNEQITLLAQFPVGSVPGIISIQEQ